MTDEHDDGAVLTPDELSLDDDSVTELDDNRYLITPDSDDAIPLDTESVGEESTSGPTPEGVGASDAAPPSEGDSAEASVERVDDNANETRATHEAPAGEDRFEYVDTATTAGANPPPITNASEYFGVEVTMKVGDDVSSTVVRSDDVREAFADTLRWYARQVDADTPPTEVLSLLLDESDLDVP